MAKGHYLGKAKQQAVRNPFKSSCSLMLMCFLPLMACVLQMSGDSNTSNRSGLPSETDSEEEGEASILPFFHCLDPCTSHPALSGNSVDFISWRCKNCPRSFNLKLLHLSSSSVDILLRGARLCSTVACRICPIFDISQTVQASSLSTSWAMAPP